MRIAKGLRSAWDRQQDLVSKKKKNQGKPGLKIHCIFNLKIALSLAEALSASEYGSSELRQPLGQYPLNNKAVRPHGLTLKSWNSGQSHISL